MHLFLPAHLLLLMYGQKEFLLHFKFFLLNGVDWWLLFGPRGKHCIKIWLFKGVDARPAHPQLVGAHGHAALARLEAIYVFLVLFVSQLGRR